MSEKDEEAILHYMYQKYLYKLSKRKKLCKSLKAKYRNMSQEELRHLNHKSEQFFKNHDSASKPQINTQNDAENPDPSNPETGAKKTDSTQGPAEPPKPDLGDPRNVSIFGEYIKKFGKDLLEKLQKFNYYSGLTPENIQKQIMKFIQFMLTEEENSKKKERAHDAEGDEKSQAQNGEKKPKKPRYRLIEMNRPEPLQTMEKPAITQPKLVDPKGIINIGNTCYSSSVLQVLFHFPRFTKKIGRFRLDRSKRMKLLKELQSALRNPEKKHKLQLTLFGAKFIESLQWLFEQLGSSEHSSVSPSRVFGCMLRGDGSKMFELGAQEDVLEFMDGLFKLVTAGYSLHEKVRLTQHVEGKSSKLNPFEGTLRERLRLSGTGEVVSTRDVAFSSIILNVRHNRLDQALKHALNYQIDDFTHEVWLIYRTRRCTPIKKVSY